MPDSIKGVHVVIYSIKKTTFHYGNNCCIPAYSFALQYLKNMPILPIVFNASGMKTIEMIKEMDQPST